MTIAKALNWGTQRLKKKKIPSPRLDAELLLRKILHLSREELYTQLPRDFNLRQQKQYNSLLQKRLDRFPLAYLIGKKEFMGLEFFVNKGVMIPRPETELLVETVLRISPQSPVIVDLGTGCGNIAISLAKHLPNAFIYAIDNSPEALKVARRNAKYHRVETQIKFLAGDLFSPLQKYNLKGKIALIVSNPPYVCSQTLSSRKRPKEINYEPREALAGGKDGLKYYHQIIPRAREYLKCSETLSPRKRPKVLRGSGSSEWLALEIGQGQTHQVIKLLKGSGYSCLKKFKDYAGINRVIAAKVS